jgi:type I restriction enzyme S subunit
MNETLEAMARALFMSWFVDFDPVRAKSEGRARQDGARSGQPRKPPNVASDLPWPGAEAGAGAEGDPGLPKPLADLFPDAFEDSELGEIPKGWDIQPLAELASYLSRGIAPSYSELGGVCVLNQKCVRDHRVNFSMAKRHDVTKRSIEGRELRVLDVLVNSTGVGTLGRVAQLWHLPERSIVDSHLTVIRAATSTNPWFLGTTLLFREAEIEELGEGSTGQTELSRVRLGRLACLVPPNVVQEHFGRLVSCFLLRITENDQESRTLATLRDTLLPKLISGELRIKDAERFLEQAT